MNVTSAKHPEGIKSSLFPYGSDEISVTRYITAKVRNYPRHKEQLNIFLSQFEDEEFDNPDAPHGRKKYLNQLVGIDIT